jgi:hypothetical protein
LQAGDFGAHARRSPNSVGAAATSLLFGLNPAASLVVGGIGRGIDSNQQSLAADRSLQAKGIWATGAGGKDRTTSGWKDFFGYDAREQEQDIIDEVKAKIKAAKVGSFDPADDGSYFDSMTTTPGFETPVEMTVDANMVEDFVGTPVNTASNAFYNRGGVGSNAASLVAPKTQPRGQQVESWSSSDLPGARTMGQQSVPVDIGNTVWTAENMSPSEYTGSAVQAADIVAAEAAFANNQSSMDYGDEGDDTGGTWGAEGNWGGYGDWGNDAY